MTQILDHYGRPIVQQQAAAKSAGQWIGLGIRGDSYLNSLRMIDTKPSVRAMDPVGNHAWVYAAAMARAINASQAPLGMYIETEDTMQERIARTKRAGLPWTGAKAGSSRSAMARHANNRMRLRGFQVKSLEPLPEHPLASLFARVNPWMTSQQLVQAIMLWMSIRGECFIVKLNSRQEPILFGEKPTEMFVFGPDQFAPRLSGNRLAYWLFTAAQGSGFGTPGQQIPLQPHQVIQFKYYNPNDPFRGLSPLAAAAAGIDLDMMTTLHNRSSVSNGGKMAGFFVDKTPGGSFATQAHKNAFDEKMKQLYYGPQNAGTIATLPGNLDYIPITMTPADMEFIESKRWTREEILAVMRVPKSVVSVTDDLNYSIQISQDKAFWEKGLIPDMRLIEDMLDYSLLWFELDNVLAMFDLSMVEALRASNLEAIKQVTELTGPQIHMPPKQAFAFAGLDHETYEGDDTAFVSPMLTTVKAVIQYSKQPQEPATTAPADPAIAAHAEKVALIESVRKGAIILLTKRKHQATWRALMTAVNDPLERVCAAKWKTWVRSEQAMQLSRFDAMTKVAGPGVTKEDKPVPGVVDIEKILTPLATMKKTLKEKLLSFYDAAIKSTFNFTSEEIGGVTTFDVTHPKLIHAMNDRVNKVIGTAPQTIQENVRRSLIDGMKEGKTIQELRQNVAEVYDMSASGWKSLQVARTETAGMVNDTRSKMFELSGIEKRSWVAADDEATRDTHVVYSASGIHPAGFNYLTLVGKAGTLEYPGDTRAPADEVINCRCIEVAER